MSERSAHQLAGARKNSLKSTGPRTPAGKAISSRNAYKLGIYAKKLGVAKSEEAAFRAWLDEWLARYDPDGVEETNTVERAAHAAWKIHRCALVEAAKLDKRQRYAKTQHLRAQRDHAEALGLFLLLGHENQTHPSHRATERYPEPDNPQPGKTFRELLEFSQGAEWLIQSWRDLLDIVDDPVQNWGDADRHRGARLFGKRPEDAMNDPQLRHFFNTINQSNGDRTNLMRDFFRAGATVCLLPDPFPNVMYSRDEVAAGRAKLRKILEKEIGRLETLKVDELDAIYELDLECAVATALFDDSESGKALRRYETACERDLHRAYLDLRKFGCGRERGNEAIAEVVDLVGDVAMMVGNNAPPSLTLPHEWGGDQIASETTPSGADQIGSLTLPHEWGGDNLPLVSSAASADGVPPSLTLPHEWGGDKTCSETNLDASPTLSGPLPTCGGGLGRGVSDNDHTAADPLLICEDGSEVGVSNPAAVEPAAKNEPIAEVSINQPITSEGATVFPVPIANSVEVVNLARFKRRLV